jgi:hypothetical protein
MRYKTFRKARPNVLKMIRRVLNLLFRHYKNQEHSPRSLCPLILD